LTPHAVSLAWLAADGYFSKRGRARLIESGLYYSSTEFERTLAILWNGVGAVGLSCTDPVIWGVFFLEFPFMSISVANDDMESEASEVPRSLSLVMLTLERSLPLVLLLTSERDIT
jgi:hypothetical protein